MRTTHIRTPVFEYTPQKLTLRWCTFLFEKSRLSQQHWIETYSYKNCFIKHKMRSKTFRHSFWKKKKKSKYFRSSKNRVQNHVRKSQRAMHSRKSDFTRLYLALLAAPISIQWVPSYSPRKEGLTLHGHISLADKVLCRDQFSTMAIIHRHTSSCIHTRLCQYVHEKNNIHQILWAIYETQEGLEAAQMFIGISTWGRP